MPGPARPTAEGRALTESVTCPWTRPALAIAGEIISAWERGAPIDRACLRAMFFRMAFATRWRSMRTEVYRTLQCEFMRVLALMRVGLPHQDIRLAALEHVVTRIYGDRIESVRVGWSVTQRIPVTLYATDEGAFELVDGHHRVTMARCMGARWVRAVVIDREAGYAAAIAREARIRFEIEHDRG